MSLNKLLRVDGPTALKRLVYGRRGEPYEIAGHKLRFVVGTRPFRLKYASLPWGQDNIARYDALQQIFLAEHLKPGMRAVDVGAAWAQDSLMMSALVGAEGDVVAFEPDPAAAVTFAENVALNPHVKPPRLVDAACSDEDGVATFYSERPGGGNSSLSAIGAGGGGHSYQVKTVTLDAALTAPPDLVKIDIEGAEMKALRGARRILASHALILCELHPYAWPDLGDSDETLRALLAPYGRRVRYLDEEGEAAPIAPTNRGYGIALLERT